ncbi:hypothetical protein A2U01_0037660 [Trifolium medium]|uniref:Uncharacterized protein n=1 Tax=Trifolium medium TaxID=97028 RepID=A0A392PYV8_9FABA|nr:hypothetical protein [Trifolium medium]
MDGKQWQTDLSYDDDDDGQQRKLEVVADTEFRRGGEEFRHGVEGFEERKRVTVLMFHGQTTAVGRFRVVVHGG